MAARRAASGGMPASTWRRASVSTAAPSSASSSLSSRSLCTTVFHRLRRRGTRGIWLLGFENQPDRDHDFRPVLLLRGELALAGRGYAVVLRPVPLGCGAPVSGNEAVLLESVQRWKERSGLHLKRPASDLRDAVGDAHPVTRLEPQRLEHQQIEGPLHDVGL